MTREYMHALPCPVCQARSAAQRDAQARIDVLTPRQLQFLKLLAEGKTNQDIGLELGLSGKTVNNGLSEIYDLLGTANRIQAARIAWEAGLW